jgi:hypothetical protein
MQVKSCLDYVTVSSLATTTYTYSVPTTAGSAATTLFTGTSLFSTTDNTNCAMTITLNLASNNAAYSGSFLSINSAGTVTAAADVPDSQTVYVKVTAGLNNAFT